MKALSLSLALLALTSTAHAVEPLDVQLNDPAYAGIVKSFLDGKRVQYRMVKAVGEHSYLKITASCDQSTFGAAGKVEIDAKIGGSESSGSSSKSNSFISRDKRLAFCQKVVADGLQQILGWVL